MALRYDEVADIIRIIDASACDELVLETPELKLVVRRRGAGGPAESAAPPPAALTSAGPQTERAAAAPRPAAPVRSPAADGGSRTGGLEIRSPMVGTFYRSPSPDAPPFVEMGSEVQKGDAICVIEVMKLFTTIYAEASGRIAHIGAENAELVEYGRVLFVIEETA